VEDGGVIAGMMEGWENGILGVKAKRVIPICLVVLIPLFHHSIIPILRRAN
jgi:hypothetical protein